LNATNVANSVTIQRVGTVYIKAQRKDSLNNRSSSGGTENIIIRFGFPEIRVEARQDLCWQWSVEIGYDVLFRELQSLKSSRHVSNAKQINRIKYFPARIH
jgi:hypothetical protein